jgi:hypothetical protein
MSAGLKEVLNQLLPVTLLVGQRGRRTRDHTRVLCWLAWGHRIDHMAVKLRYGLVVPLFRSYVLKYAWILPTLWQTGLNADDDALTIPADHEAAIKCLV